MKKKFLFAKNWFFEDFLPREPRSSVWGFRIEKEVYSGKSKYQKIEIFDTKEFGRILALDGLVQFSTKYEFVYHEMLVQPAMFYHPNPKVVLIIGGGDGLALREVLKHSVKKVFLVDIDKKVTEVVKKYFPAILEKSFGDRRLKIFNEDALRFVKRYNDFFDVIIVDLTDPTGPSERCWNIKFYKYIFQALRDGGLAGFQSGYLREPFAKAARKDLARVFTFFKIHKAFVGCFPFDEHTFSFGSKKVDFDKIPSEEINKKFKKLNIKTKYYSPEIHFSSAVLLKSRQ